MIIGYDLIGKSIFNINTPSIENISVMNITGCIIDETHMQTTIVNSSIKQNWTNGTVLLAKYDGDLEAGNILMRENPIDKLRIKRRSYKQQSFKTLKELDFDPNPAQLIYKDYTPLSGDEYEYIVVPVDSSGIEGVIGSVTAVANFEGWWIVDLDEPEKYNFQFLYNMDDMSITTEEDRTEIPTFSKYPKVSYGTRRNKKGTLSGLFIPEGYDVREQLELLDEMLAKHKVYLLKDGYGRKYMVDVHEPSETISMTLRGASTMSLNWTEVGEYID